MLEPGTLYFAYGCNMDRDRLCEVVGRTLAGGWPARVDGWTVAFNLAEDASGERVVANLVERAGCTTCGVVYRLPHAALAPLDAFEGVPELYRRATLWVRPQGRQARQAALVYLGQPDRTVRGAGRPSDEYLATCLRGAERSGVPAAYIQWLRELARGAKPDCFEGIELD